MHAYLPLIYLLLSSFSLANSHDDYTHDLPTYFAVIDAGSRASRIFIYAIDPHDATAHLKWKKGLSSSLSTQARHPKRVGTHLSPLIRFLKQRTKGHRQQTKLVLGATQGVRSLPQHKQVALLKATQSYLRKTGFPDPQVRLLSGKEEGLYAFIAANHLLPAPHPYGIIAMGGASLQVTYLPSQKPAPKDSILWSDDKGNLLTLYSHSYNGLGFESARRKWNSTSCRKQTNFSACRASILAQLRSHHLLLQIPNASGEFIALGAFYRIATAFRLPNYQLHGPNGINSLGEKLCAASPSQLHQQYPHASQNQLASACFSLAYISALFGEPADHDIVHFQGLGFDMDDPELKIPAKNHKPLLSWTYGLVSEDLRMRGVNMGESIHLIH